MPKAALSKRPEAAVKDAAAVTAEEKAGEVATNVQAHAKPYEERAGETWRQMSPPKPRSHSPMPPKKTREGSHECDGKR